MFILIEKLRARAELHCYRVPTVTFPSLNHSFTPAHKWRHRILTFRRTWDFPSLTGWCKSCLICRISETSCLKPALPKSLRAGNQVSQERPWDWSHPKHPKIFITFCLSISAPVEPQQTTNRVVSIRLVPLPRMKEKHFQSRGEITSKQNQKGTEKRLPLQVQVVSVCAEY